jgi:putative peptide zinc metalloprotease protein
MHNPTNTNESNSAPSWLASNPRLRDDVVFRPRHSGGEPIYVVEDPLRSKFYRLGKREYSFVARLDGRRTVADAIRDANRLAGDCQPLNEKEAATLLQWAHHNGLLIVTECAMTDMASPQPKRGTEPAWNPMFLRLPLVNPEPFLARLYPWAAWTYAWPATLGCVLLVVVAAARLMLDWNRFVGSLDGIFSPTGQLSLLACWAMLKLVHETSHGLVCKRYGGTVREAGLLFVLFVPIAFVDVTGSWRFRSKWQRIHTAAAGMQMELLLAAIAAIVWSAVPLGAVSQTAANVVVMASVTTVLFNANPLMRFDGYYILIDLFDLPNLYTNAQAWLRTWARRVFFGWSSPGRTVPNVSLAVLRTYAVLSLAWRISVCVGMLIGATYLWQGAGVVFALAAGVAWVVWPLAKLVKLLVHGEAGRRPDRRRFAIAATVTAATVLALLALPWPGAPRAQAIVEYDPPSVVRAASDGFVRELLVRSGQSVAAGAPLAVLRNDQLRRDLAELELKLEASKLRARGYRQRHKLANLKAEQEESAAIEKQLNELRAEIDGLTIRAPQAGRVVSRSIENMIGTYIQQGETLLDLGDDRRKSIQFSLPERELPRYQASLGRAVHVSFGSQSRLSGRLASIDPRATTIPFAAALCTPYGGTLAVRHTNRDSNDPMHDAPSYELLGPHFTGTVELAASDADQMRAGQRVTVTLPDERPTIGEHLWVVVREWFRARASAAG